MSSSNEPQLSTSVKRRRTYPGGDPKIPGISESTEKKLSKYVLEELSDLYERFHRKPPLYGHFVNILIRSDDFDEFRDEIYNLLLGLRWAKSADVYFWTHQHFDTLHKARQFIINTCAKNDPTVGTFWGTLVTYFRQISLTDESTDVQLDLFCHALNDHYTNDPVYGLRKRYEKADPILRYFGAENVQYLWVQGFFDNFRNLTEIMDYMVMDDDRLSNSYEASGTMDLLTPVGLIKTFLGDFFADQLLMEVIRIFTTSEIRERCGLTNLLTEMFIFTPSYLPERGAKIVPKAVRVLREMSDEYKNRKVTMFHIHDYHKSPREFLKWARLLLKTHRNNRYLDEQSEEYFPTLHRHLLLVFEPTTLRDVLKWGDPLTKERIRPFCNDLSVWIEDEVKQMAAKAEKFIEEEDQVRIARGVLTQTLESTTTKVCRVCSVFSSVDISHPSHMCPLKTMPDYDNFWNNFKEGKLVGVLQRFLTEQGQKKRRLDEEAAQQEVDTGSTPEPFNAEYERRVEEYCNSITRKRIHGR